MAKKKTKDLSRSVVAEIVDEDSEINPADPIEGNADSSSDSSDDAGEFHFDEPKALIPSTKSS